MKLEVSRQIYGKYPNTRFHEYPSIGSRTVLRTEGQTDGHDEANSRLRYFVTTPKKVCGLHRTLQQKPKKYGTYKVFRS